MGRALPKWRTRWAINRNRHFPVCSRKPLPLPQGKCAGGARNKSRYADGLTARHSGLSEKDMGGGSSEALSDNLFFLIMGGYFSAKTDCGDITKMQPAGCPLSTFSNNHLRYLAELRGLKVCVTSESNYCGWLRLTLSSALPS